MKNHTRPTEFILLGLSDDPELQIVIFLFLIITYILSVTGNLTIIILTLVDSHLQTPMYFFPQELLERVTGRKARGLQMEEISCKCQTFLSLLSGRRKQTSNIFFLLFTNLKGEIINAFLLLVFCAWLAGFLNIFPPVILFLQLDYCGSNIIDHFACDYFPLLQLSCSDTWLLEVIGFYSAIVILLFTLALIILSYMFIIKTILGLPSASQRKKAFSSCSSHVIVISISYGSCIFMYANPLAKEKASVNKGASILNASVPPMMNPFIYSLRNQQVKQAFKETIQKVIFFSSKCK
ncbi:hypothetical protein M91_12962 [Bos mutus]|uniref:G-protein coupled receptors family 1 profile domain-containing protein n=1 Tax=Bos mutus TaxID=72004 RepID=L8HM11_9CETA|nr:hypothetical protein M91_12962 [Bos mutus]